MSNILKQFYRGELIPVELPITLDEAQMALKKQYYQDYEHFKAGLEQGQQETLEKIMDSFLAMMSWEAETRFTDGFRLGAKMLSEVYNEDCTDTLSRMLLAK